jgi:hypothetical protein
VNIRISTTGIERYGLNIVDYANHRFKQFVDILKMDRSDLESRIDPTAIFFENSGDREIIACRIEWIITDYDDTKYFSIKEFDNLSGLSKNNHDETEPIKVEGITSKQYWFFSSGLSEEIVMKNPSGLGCISSNSYFLDPTIYKPTQGELAKQVERVKEFTIKKGILTNKQWENQKNTVITPDYHTLDIHVGIDGVLFDNGTFVGQDKTGFFKLLNKKHSQKGHLLKKVDTT